MARPTQQVDVYTIQDRRGKGKTRPWNVRWWIEGRHRAKSFRTRTEADRYRSLLVGAVGLRPSEVVLLRPRSLELPATGWGVIHVVEADVDDAGESGEPKTGRRSLPIPPVLVSIAPGVDPG